MPRLRCGTQPFTRLSEKPAARRGRGALFDSLPVSLEGQVRHLVQHVEPPASVVTESQGSPLILKVWVFLFQFLLILWLVRRRVLIAGPVSSFSLSLSSPFTLEWLLINAVFSLHLKVKELILRTISGFRF